MPRKSSPAKPPVKPDNPPPLDHDTPPTAEPSPSSTQVLADVQRVFHDYLRELERGGAAETFGVREQARCNDILTRLQAAMR